MPINLHKLLPKRDEGGGRKEREGGINMHSILPQGDPPDEERRGGISLGAIFSPAERRARAAAEEARIARLREQQAREKTQRIAEARQAIQGQGGQPRRLDSIPSVRYGARNALARAARQDPERALRLAGGLIEEAQVWNDRALLAREEIQAKLEQRDRALERLRDYPVETTRINLGGARFLQTQEKDTTALRFVKGAARGVLGGVSASATIGIRSAIAAMSGKPGHSFDQVRADETGIHADSPFSDIPHRDVTYKNFGDHDIVGNPAPIFDGLVGILSAFPGMSRERAVGLMPWGVVEVRDKRSNFTLASAPTWFPGVREGRLKRAMNSIMPVEVQPPGFMPEPSDGDLLAGAAETLGAEAE